MTGFVQTVVLLTPSMSNDVVGRHPGEQTTLLRGMRLSVPFIAVHPPREQEQKRGQREQGKYPTPWQPTTGYQIGGIKPGDRNECDHAPYPLPEKAPARADPGRYEACGHDRL